MTYDPNIDSLARIHDQYIDAYAEGNTDLDPDSDSESDAAPPPWVYDRVDNDDLYA